ncbi:MAG TPA: FAD-binding protein [Rhodospirillales bacterium]|jgi:glycolate oxidase FAD binding subunit|nr:FAD-binding protein [Rhodospirillales bacterium]
MTETLKPETAGQVLDAIKWAAADGVPLAVRGQGSKDGFGRAVDIPHCLDVSGLSAILAYEPSELYMTALAATPVAEIEAALRQNNQHMAFEPPNLGLLYGGEGDEAEGSIGGAIACNLAGPRRIQAGAARDHFLGFNAVSGRGEVFKSGGTVVKNVTGFDLSKLLAGSFGTLAVMTDVSFKVMPAAEKTRTVLVLGADDAQAMKAMAAALGSANEVSAAAHLPIATASLSGVSYVSGAGQAVTAVRVEGPGPSVEHRARALTDLLKEFGEIEELHSENSALLWREIRDVRLFEAGDNQIWRLSVPPATGADVAASLAAEIGGRVFYDWGGGLIWLSMEPQPDAAHDTVRAAVAAASASGGHATLIRAAADVRAKAPVFEPQSGALKDLSARVKQGFDPNGALNPGRMVEGE